jgi:HPt (histidine-containing phosphotransfer) domain-containing protein
MISPSSRREGPTDSITAFIHDDGSGNHVETHSQDATGLEEYDVSAALQAMEGDEALLYSLFNIFNETTPVLIRQMRESIQAMDRQNFQRHVHQMKGALSAVRAGREAKMAERLEQKASLASFSHINSEMTELENVIKD